MAILLVNPAGNTPQGVGEAEGEELTFPPAPGPRHADGVVLLYSTLPAVQSVHPAADVLLSNPNELPSLAANIAGASALEALVFTAPPTTSEDRAATMTAIALAESGGRTEVTVGALDGLAVARAVKGGEFDCSELVQWAAGHHTDDPVAHVTI